MILSNQQRWPASGARSLANGIRLLASGCIAMFVAAMFATAMLAASSADAAGMRLGDICRVKGQETNTLQGLGLVVGLRGTGDGEALPTQRALARMMQLMGGPVGFDQLGQPNLQDVADAKNVALVFVNATIPAAGAQAGDTINVTVNAITAKSLEGGTLMLTPLLGPRVDNPVVYATAQGKLNVSLDGPATTATIQAGAKMEANVKAKFHKDGIITLVLEKDFAGFDTAHQIQLEINNSERITDSSVDQFGRSVRDSLARAIDPSHVEVRIPRLYHQNPIAFITEILRMNIRIESHSSRVVINEREGVVVIGKDVEIAPALVTHRNLRIEAGAGGFAEINNQTDQQVNAKLKSLADALNALDVPAEDLIAIIRTLKAKGDLYGEVVFQ